MQVGKGVWEKPGGKINPMRPPSFVFRVIRGAPGPNRTVHLEGPSFPIECQKLKGMLPGIIEEEALRPRTIRRVLRDRLEIYIEVMADPSRRKLMRFTSAFKGEKASLNTKSRLRGPADLRFGWEAGIRTPILRVRAACPTVERPPSRTGTGDYLNRPGVVNPGQARRYFPVATGCGCRR